VIVGSQGPETTNLTRQIHTLNLAKKVHLLAAIDDRQLCWLYQQCLAFIIPSSIEGFCLPFAEAIHLACKVVCTDLPIFREIGSPSCIYVDLHSEPLQHLTAAIVQVIAQPPPAIDPKPSHFSKQVIADRYLQFYADILNS
jgi:glycosyltransferase involved in cell wall biosynthesis